jgi:hypothetical protein
LLRCSKLVIPAKAGIQPLSCVLALEARSRATAISFTVTRWSTWAFANAPATGAPLLGMLDDNGFDGVPVSGRDGEAAGAGQPSPAEAFVDSRAAGSL